MISLFNVTSIEHADGPDGQRLLEVANKSSINFKHGQQDFSLNREQVVNLLTAKSSWQACRQSSDSLWDKICIFFGIGEKVQVVKSLFREIYEVTGNDAMPADILLAKWKKLSSYISADCKEKIGVSLQTDYNNPNRFKINFHIGNELISSTPNWIEIKINGKDSYSGVSNMDDLNNKLAILEALTWNYQLSLSCMKNTDSPVTYAREMIPMLTDNQSEDARLNSIEGTSQGYLRAHFYDEFFCRSNFKGIRESTNDTLFDAVFAANGEERVLQLSNRDSQNGEMRGMRLQEKLGAEKYNNLQALMETGYGTCEDVDMRYAFLSLQSNLRTVLGNEYKQDPELLHVLNETTVQRPGAAPLALSRFLETA